MKTWVKWLGVAATCSVAGTAIAADHTDGPAVIAAPSADIADLYAWAPGSTSNLVLIQTAVGAHSENVLYTFHVGRSDMPALLAPPATWTNVICQFDAMSNVSCWAGDSDYVSGDASANAGITSAAGTMKVHTGDHADPFFFYLTGFNTAVETVKGAAAGLTFNAAGCPTVDQATSNAVVGILNGNGNAVNNFAAANVSAIVVELDKDLIDGTGEHFSIWASTNNLAN